ncbi:MAG TPA: LysM domain-containing protein, partial [Phycisphaerae bacterium]|nr:LysM domain-containing protein [Phycisphaerae bacterium]
RRPRSVEEPAPASPSGAGAATPSAAGSSGASRPPLTYVVGEGETLTQIARNALKDGGRWREIYELNRDKLSSPDVLIPGMVLRLPAGERSRGPERG